MIRNVQNHQKDVVEGGSCNCTMLTFSSLLQKASNFPNIYISETSKDFSPEDSKICFLVLWKDAWYSLNRKMQSCGGKTIKRRGKKRGETFVKESKTQKFYPHTELVTSVPQQGLLLLIQKLKFSVYKLKGL